MVQSVRSLVAEVEVSALLLRQTTDEVDVSLVVLHAVHPRLLGLGQLVIDVGAPLAEDLPDDIRDAHFLESGRTT